MKLPGFIFQDARGYRISIFIKKVDNQTKKKDKPLLFIESAIGVEFTFEEANNFADNIKLLCEEYLTMDKKQ